MLIHNPSINNHSVICNGSVVLNKGEHFDIFPIPSDPVYCVRFNLHSRSEVEHDLFVEDLAEYKGVIVNVKIRLNPSFAIGTLSPNVIAVEEDFKSEYAVSLYIVVTGDHSSYTALLSYTFIQRPISEGTI